MSKFIGAVKHLLLGKPLPNKELSHEKMTRFWGLPIMASDAVSSVAYAVEEMLMVLVPIAGVVALGMIGWISSAIILLLMVLIFSYAKIIDHYPNGGGAYNVSKENLGILPAMLAAAALIIDYVLTVAVSISSSTAALLAAMPSLAAYRVPISLACLLLITLINLRGIREAAKIFGLPTYAFIVSMVIMIFFGLFKAATGTLGSSPMTGVLPESNLEAITLIVLLRAFSSGCSALTGVEAVSNAVPSFNTPSRRNAKHVLFMLAAIIVVIFGGTTFLAWQVKVVPQHGTTVLSSIATAVFGNGFMYYVVQVTTSLILLLAANTAFNGLPLLLMILAKDGYMPRQFSFRGLKLSFSNGILFITVAAGLLLILFQSDTHRLIPLYSVGVFFSFTLSQFGMLIKWIRDKEPGWQYKMWINGVGALVTLVGSIIVFTTKFAAGAWILLVAIPVIMLVMLRIKKHYDYTAKQLSIEENTPIYGHLPANHNTRCIVLVNAVNKATLKALNYANSIFDTVEALHISNDEEQTAKMLAQWEGLNLGIPITQLDAPYRNIYVPLDAYIGEQQKHLAHAEALTVVMVRFVTEKLSDMALHNQTTYFIANCLARYKNVVTIQVPYLYKVDAGRVE